MKTMWKRFSFPTNHDIQRAEKVDWKDVYYMFIIGYDH